MTQEQTENKQPEQIPELAEQQEIQLTDGQTENLPEFNGQPQTTAADYQSSAVSLQMMTTNNARYFSEDEFQREFDEFLTFLKNPQTATDTFETLRAEGQTLAAAKIYNMATKYKWLRFIIDRRTQVIHDALVLSIFAVTETNAIVYNWTGISIIGKFKIWLKGKVKQRAEVAQQQGKRRSVWAFLARQGAAKQQKQETSSETSNE